MFKIASPPVVLSFLTKAPFNLCCDTSELYLAASIDVSYFNLILQKKKKKIFFYRKQFMFMIVVHMKNH